MSISPMQARLVFCAFLLVSGGIAVNILYLQEQAQVSSHARSKAERAKQRAEAERARRLALAPKEAPARPREPMAMAGIASVASVGTGRLGRFAPSAGQLDDAPQALAEPEPRTPELVKAVQAQLAQRGYEPGSSDGVVGLMTRAAIMAYEHDHGLPLTGEPAEPLLLHLQGAAAARAGPARGQRPARAPHAEQLMRTVQHSLAQLGYFAGKVDGLGGEDTARAIREYEMDAGLVPTGRISAPLIARLARSASNPKSVSR